MYLLFVELTPITFIITQNLEHLAIFEVCVVPHPKHQVITWRNSSRMIPKMLARMILKISCGFEN